MLIRLIEPADHPQALVMNNAAVPAVNAHDEASFGELVDLADRTWVVDDDGELGAMLVVFAPGAGYRSDNYRLLSKRFDSFSYVDRIIVAPTHKRMGLGSRLYETHADHARSVVAARLLCEVNIDPPNPQSITFHSNTGWTALDDHEHAPGKVVRYFEKPVGAVTGANPRT